MVKEIFGPWQKRRISRRGRRQFGRGRRRLKGLSQLFQATPASSQLASRTTRWETFFLGSHLVDERGLTYSSPSQRPHLVTPCLARLKNNQNTSLSSTSLIQAYTVPKNNSRRSRGKLSNLTKVRLLKTRPHGGSTGTVRLD